MSRRTSNPAVRRNQRGGHLADAGRRCLCDRPTRDAAFICDTCLDQLTADLTDLIPTAAITTAGVRPELVHLGRVSVVYLDGDRVGVATEWCPWPRPLEQDTGLWSALKSVIAGERGIDYRTLGGASGGTVATGLVLNEIAVRRADELTATLRRVVRFCMDHRIQHHAPSGWRPNSASEVPAMAEWLSKRTTGLAHHPDAVTIPSEIRRAVENTRKIVMPDQALLDLGPCLVDGCDGRFTAGRDDTFTTCEICGAWLEARVLRDALISELEERLVTAAEAAHLSTYLALRSDRDRVRRRVNDWAHRGRLVDPRVAPWQPGWCPLPAPRDLRFRFGDIYDLLIQLEDLTIRRTA